MLAGHLKFDSIPQIGFAHHHYSGEYVFDYKSTNNSFEIVYINSGTIVSEFNGNTFYAHEGDIFVLFRHLPIKLYSYGKEDQSHCTIQLQFDYTFELINLSDPLPDDGVILPFITKQSIHTKAIKKALYEIVHQVSTSPDRYSFNSTLKTVEIMQKLNTLARDTVKKENSSHSNIANLVENYVKDNINKKIYLKDISAAIGKSPNYINFAFKNARGTTITEYINEEKINIITTLMKKYNIHFSKACNHVGIIDISYGYRLFKKHTGLTPNMFLKSAQILR